MLSIAVCDDDELHRKRTVALIRNTPGFENSLIREFSRAENLLDSISEDHYLPDVAVLDIQMDEMDGIELAMRLNRSVPECQIIFLTGYISYATRAYDAEHVFYVLKTETDSRLGTALNKAAEKKARLLMPADNNQRRRRIPAAALGSGPVSRARAAAHENSNFGRRALDEHPSIRHSFSARQPVLLSMPQELLCKHCLPCGDAAHGIHTAKRPSCSDKPQL